MATIREALTEGHPNFEPGALTVRDYVAEHVGLTKAAAVGLLEQLQRLPGVLDKVATDALAAAAAERGEGREEKGDRGGDAAERGDG